MKTLLKSLFLAVLLAFISLQSFAQDAEITLQEFVLQVPTVNKLAIRPIGAPKMAFLTDTLHTELVQDVYYQLKRADGRTVEDGNKTIPIAMWNLALKYITKNPTTQEVAYINAYLSAASFTNVVAIKPPQ